MVDALDVNNATGERFRFLVFNDKSIGSFCPCASVALFVDRTKAVAAISVGILNGNRLLDGMYGMCGVRYGSAIVSLDIDDFSVLMLKLSIELSRCASSGSAPDDAPESLGDFDGRSMVSFVRFEMFVRKWAGIRVFAAIDGLLLDPRS